MLGRIEERVVRGEIAQHERVDQQRGVGRRGIGRLEMAEFRGEVGEQGVLGGGVAHHPANLAAGVDTLGERTEVEPDHRALEPRARGGGVFLCQLRWKQGHGGRVRGEARAGEEAVFLGRSRRMRMAWVEFRR